MEIFPNESLFIQIANFVFLIWVMNLLLFKPIRTILKKRQAKLTSLKEGIESANAGAEAQDSAYLEGVRAARAQGLKEKEALVAEATAEEKALIQKINDKAQADLAQIKAEIAQDVDAVRQSLQAEVDNFATAIGQKILGRAL